LFLLNINRQTSFTGTTIAGHYVANNYIFVFQYLTFIYRLEEAVEVKNIGGKEGDFM